MGGDRRRSPEGDRGLRPFSLPSGSCSFHQYEREINLGCLKKQTIFSLLQRISPLRRRQGGFPLAPSTPSGCTPMLLGFYRKFYGSFPYRFPNQHNKPVTWECAAKGSRGRSQTSSVPIAPLSHPQTRNLRAADKFYFIKAPPHNSAARLAMPFPPSAACKFLDLPPVNLRNLHLHLTKNPFASRPPHLCGVTLEVRIPKI